MDSNQALQYQYRGHACLCLHEMEGIKRSLRGVVMIESSSWQVCEREPTAAQFQVPSVNLGYRVSFNTSGDVQVSTASFDRAQQAPLSPGEVRGR